MIVVILNIQTANHMTDIFISYSRSDQEWVAKLANALEGEAPTGSGSFFFVEMFGLPFNDDTGRLPFFRFQISKNGIQVKVEFGSVSFAYFVDFFHDWVVFHVKTPVILRVCR
jgi:hypothetical protein